MLAWRAWVQKNPQNDPFAPFPLYLFVSLIKTQSDPWLRAVIGAKHRNSTSNDQNIIGE